MFTSVTSGRSHARKRLGLLLIIPLMAGLLYSAMAAAPASAAPTATTAKLQKVMKVAKSKKGTPYRYGASGPTAFDCSGFTRWVYKKVGVKLPRTSRAQVAKTVKTKKPKVGDLVFFHGSGGRVYHVGIYAGKKKIWHAPSAGGKVRLQKIWTRSVTYGDVKGI